MPAPPMVSMQVPTADGPPGYAVPLNMYAPVYQAMPADFYGDSGLPVPQANVSMAHVVRGVMAHTYQQYDKNISYANDSYDYVDTMPDLDMDNTLSGLGLQETVHPAVQPDEIKDALPPPVKSSTVFAVIAGSALLVGASIAVFAYFRSKK